MPFCSRPSPGSLVTCNLGFADQNPIAASHEQQFAMGSFVLSNSRTVEILMEITKKQMRFSRFTHRFHKDGIVAYMNSLRMRPIYLSAAMAERVDTYIAGDQASEASSETQSTIDKFVNSKIVIDTPDFDDLVLSRYRGIAKNTFIKIAYFILTDQCNFNCSYCFIKKEIEKGNRISGPMSVETALAAVDTFARLTSEDPTDDERMIIFYGGEPLLNFSVIKIISDRVSQLKGMGRLPSKTKMVIVTNGSLLSDEIALFFKSVGIGIGISIDGTDIVTNSARRYRDGTPTFSDIMRGIETCKRNQILDYSLSVTVSKTCLENFDSTISFLKTHAISKNIGFNILMSDGSNDEFDSYAHLASSFIIKAFEIFREDGIYEDRIMRKVNAFIRGQAHLFDCAATGANQIVIAPDGEIGICHGFLGSRTFFSDNVHNPEFDPRKNTNFQEWSKRTPINMPQCLGCESLGLCGGGCPFNAHKNSGSIWELDRRFCIHTKATLEWLIWDLYDKALADNVDQ